MINKKSLPIGVFDSGIGGLTVLNELVKRFPNEDFVYVGDTLNLPYGTKTKEELESLVDNVANYLNSVPVKAICIACNTATTASAHLLNKYDFPIIGVIKPTAEYSLTFGSNILVLATNVTIASNAYQNILDNNNPNNGKRFYCKCSEFVDLIENIGVNNEKSFKLVHEKLDKYAKENIDVIVCGCTHFGLLEKEFKEIFPNAKIVDSSYPTYLKLYNELKEKDLLSDSKSEGKVIINLTKAQDNFLSKTKWFSKPYTLNIIDINK